MKRILCVVLICLMLSGCSFLFARKANTDPPHLSVPTAPTQMSTEPSTQPAVTVSIPTVSFEMLYENGKEYACITAVGEDGSTVWSFETDRYDVAQLSRVADIGQWLWKYYYVDGGDVVALDLRTGFELWRYAGFNGSPAGPDATYIDPAGTVYLCGFFGPDYFAIDTNGNLLDLIPQLHPDYYCAHKLIPGDGIITVCFSGGPEGDLGPEAYKIDVSTEGYPQVIYGGS